MAAKKKKRAEKYAADDFCVEEESEAGLSESDGPGGRREGVKAQRLSRAGESVSRPLNFYFRHSSPSSSPVFGLKRSHVSSLFVCFTWYLKFPFFRTCGRVRSYSV